MSKMMFDLIGNVALPVTRGTSGSWVKGKWVEGGTLPPFDIRAHVQPAKMQELLLVPEGERTRQWIRIFTTDDIRTLKEGVGGYPADLVEWKGETYRVMKVEEHEMGVLDHIHALAVREPLTPDGG